MKNITLVVPIYKAEEFLIKNKEMWKKLLTYAKVIFVEDSKEEKSKGIANEIGVDYFSKSNGNWGSVINFVKNKKLIKTDFYAIVDADDKINIQEFEVMTKKLNTNYDVFVSKFTAHNFATGVKKSLKKTWIHSMWLKTSVLYNLKDLPEGIYYMDNFLIAPYLSSRIAYIYDVSPYIYSTNLPNQSTTFGNKFTDMQIQSFYGMAENSDWFKENEIKGHKKYKKKAIGTFAIFLSKIIERSTNKELIKSSKELFLEYCKVHKGSKSLLWAKLFRFFNLKRFF